MITFSWFFVLSDPLCSVFIKTVLLQEKKYDSGYPDVYTPKSLGSQSDHRRSHKGCSFSTDIHQTKILSGTLRRNNFCKIRPGQCLNAPWNIPTKIASTQNCHCAFINTAKTVIPVYAAIQVKISFPVSYFSASLPNRMENGNATNCVTSNARSSPVESSPRAEPYAVAISIIV